MNSEDIKIEETCGGCPHCIRFYDEHDTEVGGLRYRWGHFQFWPVVEGADLDNIIDTCIDEEKGIIPYDREDDITDYCREVLASWFNNEELPDDRDDYIKSLLEE